MVTQVGLKGSSTGGKFLFLANFIWFGGDHPTSARKWLRHSPVNYDGPEACSLVACILCNALCFSWQT
ncbi:hypothetical protein SERLA73DRAFT_186773 [Serpula lacrymans var. lacrymans S7.3]|uniref:Uncharacterized protein n=2 Tax=Serpula lacrymans var. lacrymans TaxID=341189 RepID=F8Q7V4_SERL3|nr:uncharacterized protein SERLADRAFT_475995 [Serpula lacrymans var. lacrymans S7.9]EGN95642.1 hypothetical protein SERLA73DRAFT_186773 [Serpula lacrymans var. lacrymans S7.3]EGO21169.1 hypothetical protein SERLADRAFT_475995 [Serpula lacrymans var. lacrymans S7.9]